MNAMRTIRLRYPLLLLVALSGVAVLHATENESSRIVREVGESYLQALTRDNPLRQLRLGLPIDVLPDYSFAATEQRAKDAAALLARLGKVRPADLAYDETLSLDVLRRHLQTRVDDPKGFYFQWQVTPYSSPIGAVAPVFAGMPLATDQDRARYLARLQDIKTLAATIAANIRGQVTRGIRIPKPELVLVDRFLESFAVTGEGSPFRPAASRLQALAPAERESFLKSVDARILTVVAPSIHSIAAMLRGDYAARAPAAVGLSQYPGGLDTYRALVKFHTTMDVTPEQVHTIGLENVARVNAEMAKIREELKFTGTQAEFKASLRSNPKFFPKTPDEIGERLMTYVRRIEPVMDRYFGRKPVAPYGVKRLDPQLEPGQTFGFYEVPTATDPRGYYRYNGSNLADRSLLNAGALIYHELIPGHHFQISLTNENTGIPEFRREVFDTAFTEGWGDYASHVAGEMGMYADPYDRYGRLAMEMFISVRLVVDTGMNALGWSRDKAIAYMQENAMETDTQIASETLRYCCDMPGQALAYRMGSQRILQLREHARTALGDRFDIRKFHDWILGSGSLPMTTVEGHVRAFIEREKQ
jgi:uncharacterized protein (DUF885 family)